MLRYVALLLFVVSCGRHNEPKTPDVTQNEQTIEVGSKDDYELDPLHSSTILKSGKLSIEVTEKSSAATKFKVTGIVKTVVAQKVINVTQSVPNDILSVKFLGGFRQTKEYANESFKMSYLGVVGNCEEILLYDMKGYEWLKVKGLLCLTTKNVPQLKAKFVIFGQMIEAMFLLNN